MVVIITSTGGVSKRVFTFDRRWTPGSRTGPRRTSTSSSSAPAWAPALCAASSPTRPSADGADLRPDPDPCLHRAGRDRRRHALRGWRRPPRLRAALPGRGAAQRADGDPRAAGHDARSVSRRSASVGSTCGSGMRTRRPRCTRCPGGRELRLAVAQPGDRLGHRAHVHGLRVDHPLRARGCRSALPVRRRGLRGRLIGMARDYYDVLGVPREADDGQVKKAFRRWRGSCTRTSTPTTRRRRRSSRRPPRLRGALRRRAPPPVRHYGHEGLRSGGYARTSTASAPSPTCSGVLRRWWAEAVPAAAPCRAATSPWPPRSTSARRPAARR